MAKSQSYPETVPPEYQADDTREAYRSGWNHGHGIDRHNIREIHQETCNASADNSRQYSPFEFTAKEFNDCGDGGFRIATADHDSDVESTLFDTLEDAEREALEGGYALIRDYVWEASGYYTQTAEGVSVDVYATRQDAMDAANEVGCVAVIDEVSSSEELWEAFEAGTSDAIQADLETYNDSDYGIEDDDNDSGC